MIRRSPLQGASLPDGLREVPFHNHVNLRADPATVDGVAAVLGVAPPTTPNTFLEAGSMRVLWLGPDEWLIVAPPDSGADLERRLREAGAAAVDVSANRTTLELWGARARDALESGCSVDLHPKAFGPGRVVQTLVGRTSVVLAQVGDEPRYELLVRPSFAAYLAAFLADALTAAD